MAEALVAGPVLSAVFNVLFEKMASKEVVDFFKQRKLNDEVLQKLKRRMNTVSGLLEDAEEKQITKLAVRNWLDDLKDVAYDADDLLDEIAYKAREREHLEAGPKTCSDQVRNFFSSLNPCKKGIGELEPKLEKILARIDDLLQQKDFLNLEKSDRAKPSLPSLRSSEGRLTTSLVDESGIYGRDGNKEAIIKLLLTDDERLGVVPIVGMGGVGKTTLSQLVYKDSRVKERFGKLKAWICVSEEFDVLKMTQNILKEIGSSDCDSKSPNALQLQLEAKIRGEKFLLVLDDVWNDNYADWEFLLAPLKSAAQGSKVLVTTREEKVASVMSTVPIYHLKELCEDDCWLLFAKHAFDGHDSDADAGLKEAGRKIVRKCKGLPLAAKTIGSLLRLERTITEWKNISESNMWDLKDDKIIPALRLSYHYLPPHLKQCFVYCAMFPKDFQFNQYELILLWMAEGFIVEHTNKRKEMEEICEEYFEDLLSRSFFQKSEFDEDLYVMHDLINDLAKSIAREFCYNNVDDASSGQVTKRTRHLFYKEGNGCNALEELESLSKAVGLRTLIYSIKELESLSKAVVNFLSSLKHLRVLRLEKDNDDEDDTDISDLVCSFKHLRILRLQKISIRRIPENIHTLSCLQTLIIVGCRSLVNLPNSIGDLKNLRHLYLGETSIERLPDSICGLHSLQYLSLPYCSGLVELPAKMMELANLCSLFVRGTKLKSMPRQMGKLNKLKILSDFVVGKDEGSSIAELGHLWNLKDELCLRNLQNVGDEQDALEAKIKDKNCLERLKYMWEDDDNDAGSSDRKLLEYLQPHVNIKYIKIKGYRGSDFPNWVGDSRFSNMGKLSLKDCKYCTCLPPLGQLAFLKNLCIKGFVSIVSVGAELYGHSKSFQPFRSLIELEFNRMPKWQEWTCCYEKETQDDGFKLFPLLQDLTISDCPKLEMGITEGTLPSTLQNLTIKGCNKITHWDLHKLSSLTSLYLDSIQDIQSFPGKISMPSSLSCIMISDLQDLKSLDYTGLQHLTSLKQLFLFNCPNLGCIPEEGVPKSLLYLCICDCPLLEQRCQREQGEDWPKISYIPDIYIGYIQL